MDARELLRNVSIFQGVEDDILERLVPCLKKMHFAREAMIVGQSDPGDALFLIATGRVKVVLRGGGGREVILTMFRAGDFFGEMSLLDNQPRSASVVAVEPSELLVLERQDFVAHLQQSPTTALKILAVLSLRLRRADEVIGNLALLDVYSRVARGLVELGRRDGQQTEEGVLIRERPTHQELADMIGASRETVSRVLSELQRRGAIHMRGKAMLLSVEFSRSTVDALE